MSMRATYTHVCSVCGGTIEEKEDLVYDKGKVKCIGCFKRGRGIKNES